MDEVYCFAKSAERSKQGQTLEISQAWKKLVADKFADAADSDIERLASSAKLCRKCFLVKE